MSALSLVLVTDKVRAGLRRLALRIVRDTGAADSIMEDAVTRALERVERDRPVNFLAWLYEIARNMARHWIRDRKSWFAMLSARMTRQERSALAEALTREALGLFDAAVGFLTEAQKRVLLMRLVDSMSFEEISERTGIRENACRALMHRARRRLRSWAGYMAI